MGEAYIVRRGGTGRDGVGGQSNIFFFKQHNLQLQMVEFGLKQI